MFERYTDESRRAIFFARHAALSRGKAAIDSNHLLLGLVWEKGTRADALFQLRVLLPEETSQKTTMNKAQSIESEIPLSDDSKRALACTAIEADQLKDYWIDTDHLVLGILREDKCSAAAKLRAVGLKLESARKLVVDNKSSRPRRRVSLWRQVILTHPVGRALSQFLFPSRVGLALQIAFFVGVILAMVLLSR
jgi:ATP-dependent Clp protease ATP-binding subunit ClpC